MRPAQAVSVPLVRATWLRAALAILTLAALRPAIDAAPLDECRVAAQSPTEVLLACRFDGSALAADATRGRSLPPLGYIAVPRGATAALEVVAGGSPGDQSGAATAGLRLAAPRRLRGLDLVGLEIDPAALERGSLARGAELTVRVRFAGGDGSFGDARLRSRLWEPLITRLVLNHASLPPLAPAAAGRPDRDEGCEYVILCPAEAPFTTWADSLRAWRTLQGITTQVFTTTEVGSTWQEIRDFLVNAYTTWTVPPAAFLLLGDHPSSGDGRQPGLPAPLYNSYAASDNLYADVDGDGLPDMIPGRITARTEAELAVMIGKLLAHERTPSLDPAFYAHPVLATGWEPDGRCVMELETLYGFQSGALGLEPVREYVAVSPGSAWPDPAWVAAFGPAGLGYLPATPGHLHDWGGSAERINADIDAGAFMLIHRGQGSTTSWGDPLYTTSDVAGLSNTHFPFVFSLDALTGKFNGTATCLTEALHRSPHGALGMISASEVSYALPATRLMLHLLDCLWPSFLDPGSSAQPELRPAAALVAAKYALALDQAPVSPQQKQVTYHLFHHHGDPWLVMNTTVPAPLAVAHDDHCAIGASAFTVQAEAGAWVGLTIDGALVGAGAGTGTPVAIPITPPAQAGALRITVTGQNRLRYDARVPIRDAGGVSAPAEVPAPETRLSLTGTSPFRSVAFFTYTIPAASAGGRATLRIHDASGRCVRTLADGPHAAGVFRCAWNGMDETGAPAGTGVYFARLNCAGQVVTGQIARLE